jgi:hypothetical protein
VAEQRQRERRSNCSGQQMDIEMASEPRRQPHRQSCIFDRRLCCDRDRMDSSTTAVGRSLLLLVSLHSGVSFLQHVQHFNMSFSIEDVRAQLSKLGQGSHQQTTSVDA